MALRDEFPGRRQDTENQDTASALHMRLSATVVKSIPGKSGHLEISLVRRRGKHSSRTFSAHSASFKDHKIHQEHFASPTTQFKMTLVNQLLPINFNLLYINGTYSKPHSTEQFSVLNPKDSTLVADNIPIANDVDVDAAIKHAEDAFNGTWSQFSGAQRSQCFHRLVDLLEERLPDILRLDSLTTGNPVSLIPTREENYIKNCLLYYGELCQSLSGN